MRRDTNGVTDVFVHDLRTGITTIESLDSSGGQVSSASFVPVLSADGSLVAFDSLASDLVPDDTNGVRDVFLRDRVAATTRRVSISSTGVEGNDHSHDPSISADGLVVAFDSGADNLVADDTSAFGRDAFVRDERLGVTVRVSVDSNGEQATDSGPAPTHPCRRTA